MPVTDTPVTSPAETADPSLTSARFSGQVALITGAGSGIGRASALLLARSGARVGLLGRTEEQLREVEAAVVKDGGRADVLVADVAREEQVEAAVSALVASAGRLDIVFANEDDIRYGLGVVRSRTERSGETGSTESYRQLAERVAGEFGIQMVAMTLRERAAGSDNTWSGLLYEQGSNTLFESAQYPVAVVEPIGASDAFTAGLIYAVLAGRSAERALAFAVAAGALKHTIPGDYNRVSAAEVDRLATGEASLQR